MQKNDFKRQSGFTLVEIMVAMVLSLILGIAIVTVFVNNSHSFTQDDNVLRMQDEYCAPQSPRCLEPQEAHLSLNCRLCCMRGCLCLDNHCTLCGALPEVEGSVGDHNATISLHNLPLQRTLWVKAIPVNELAFAPAGGTRK